MTKLVIQLHLRDKCYFSQLTVKNETRTSSQTHFNRLGGETENMEVQRWTMACKPGFHSISCDHDCEEHCLHKKGCERNARNEVNDNNKET